MKKWSEEELELFAKYGCETVDMPRAVSIRSRRSSVIVLRATCVNWSTTSLTYNVRFGSDSAFMSSMNLLIVDLPVFCGENQ